MCALKSPSKLRGVKALQGGHLSEIIRARSALSGETLRTKVVGDSYPYETREALATLAATDLKKFFCACAGHKIVLP